jgi:hypothetical protein
MQVTPNLVLSRYLGKQARLDVLADERFQPPKWLVNAVTPVEEGGAGDMQVEALNVWKYVAQGLGSHFSYGAATKYWRNKCLKMGYTVPEKYLEGGGGEGASGPWKVKSGDQIEEWVKATLRSKKLLVDVGHSVHDWQLEINSLERHIAETQETVEKHLAGISAGNRVNQRQKWLEKATKDLDGYQKELTAATTECAKLLEVAQRYDEHQSPTLDFEQQFQFMMLLAQKEFDKKTVVAAVQKALDRFEQGLDIEGLRTAGLGDMLSRAWEFIKNAWSAFTDWVSDLTKTTRDLDKLLTSAGA